LSYLAQLVWTIH